MSRQTILETIKLSTWFPLKRGILSRVSGYVRAVNDVSLRVEEGETLGLVGESGCGKTTLGRSLLGLEKVTSGRVLFKGRDMMVMSGVDLRAQRRSLQMIFQDPFSSLNPRMSVMDLVTEGMAHHGLLESPREEEASRLMQEVGLDPDSMYRYPHEFSGGQRQRICVARALSMSPDFIVCDEAVSALDVSVQAQVINLLVDLRERRGLAYLFISHDLSVVRLISDRVAVMYLGRIVEIGPSEAVSEDPLHPYTKALLSAVPVPRENRPPRIVLGGELPSPLRPPEGCPFHPRCPEVMSICRRQMPEEREMGGRCVRCHLWSDDGDTRPPANELSAIERE